MTNPFDQFDAADTGNPFDNLDDAPLTAKPLPGVAGVIQALGDTSYKIAKNAPESATNYAKGIYHAVTNPKETAKGMFSVVKGLAAQQAQYDPHTQMALSFAPQRTRDVTNDALRANAEATRGPLDAIGEDYKEHYGSPSAAYDTLTKDPFRLLSDASLFVRPLDPTLLAMRAGAVPVKAGGKLIAKAWGASSGGGGRAIEEAYKAAESGNKAQPAHMRGNADMYEPVTAMTEAARELRNDASREYVELMKGPKADKQVLSLAPAQAAVDAARDEATFNGIPKRRVTKTLDVLQKMLDERAGFSVPENAPVARPPIGSNPAQSKLMAGPWEPSVESSPGIKYNYLPDVPGYGPSAEATMHRAVNPRVPNAPVVPMPQIPHEIPNAPHGPYPNPHLTAAGLDDLKKAVGDEYAATKPNTLKRKAVGSVYNAIKDTITEQAPAYADIMSGYKGSLGALEDMRAALGAGGKASKDTQLGKLQSILRTNVASRYGKRLELAEVLAEKRPDLIPMLSGQALNSWLPRTLPARMELGLEGITAATHNPAALALIPFTSPRLAGETARLAGLTAKQLKRIPASVLRLPNAAAQADRFSFLGGDE